MPCAESQRDDRLESTEGKSGISQVAVGYKLALRGGEESLSAITHPRATFGGFLLFPFPFVMGEGRGEPQARLHRGDPANRVEKALLSRFHRRRRRHWRQVL